MTQRSMRSSTATSRRSWVDSTTSSPKGSNNTSDNRTLNQSYAFRSRHACIGDACARAQPPRSTEREASKMTDPDSIAIRTTALDYIDGFYTGDAERMERAVHAELAKRIVTVDAASGKSHLDQMSAMTLVQRTRAGTWKTDTVGAKTRRCHDFGSISKCRHGENCCGRLDRLSTDG